MIDSIVKAASELKEKVSKKSELVKLLNEATNNDNWNISNSKLLIISDHTYDWNEYNIIMKHLWDKLSLKPKEFRKIFKALHTLEFLMKNGAPRIIQEVKDDLYKIRSLQDMEYTQEGKDKCSGIREKSKIICELALDKERLDEERDFAKKNRDKFSHVGGGISSSNASGSYGANSYGGSSSKYQGFGSQDLAKYSGGYNLNSTGNKSGYDPHSSKKGSSVFDEKEKKGKTKDKDGKKGKESKSDKKKSKKKKKKSESDSSDSSDKESDSSSSDDSDEDSKEESDEKNKNKTKSKGITKPKINEEREIKTSKQKDVKKKETKKEEKVAEKTTKKENILELLESNDNIQQNNQLKSNNQTNDIFNLNFNEFNSNANIQSSNNMQNMFQNMNISSGNQNDLFSGLNSTPTSQPFVQNQTQGMSNWMTGSTSIPQQQNLSNLASANTMNLFGDMNISNPISQPVPSSQAASGFSLFDGMSYQPTQSQPVQTQFVPRATQQPKAQEKQKSPLDDDFGDFQDSSIRAQTEPGKEDSWAVGRHLFDLSKLKKDNELKTKEKGFYKGVPGKTSLYTKGEDLNDLWNGAVNSQNLAKHQTTSNTKTETFGFGYQQPFSYSSTQGSGTSNYQGTSTFGGASSTSGASVFSSSFPTSSQGSDVFGSQNLFASSGVFPNTNAFPSASVFGPSPGGFSSASGFPSTGGFPTTGAFPSTGGFPSTGTFTSASPTDPNSWQFTMGGNGASTGVFGSNTQQNKNPFF